MIKLLWKRAKAKAEAKRKSEAIDATIAMMKELTALYEEELKATRR